MKTKLTKSSFQMTTYNTKEEYEAALNTIRDLGKHFKDASMFRPNKYELEWDMDLHRGYLQFSLLYEGEALFGPFMERKDHMQILRAHESNQQPVILWEPMLRLANKFMGFLLQRAIEKLLEERATVLSIHAGKEGTMSDSEEAVGEEPEQ